MLTLATYAGKSSHGQWRTICVVNLYWLGWRQNWGAGKKKDSVIERHKHELSTYFLMHTCSLLYKTQVSKHEMKTGSQTLTLSFERALTYASQIRCVLN
jgi:hypothetical protein